MQNNNIGNNIIFSHNCTKINLNKSLFPRKNETLEVISNLNNYVKLNNLIYNGSKIIIYC